jgi:hypothetical protein
MLFFYLTHYSFPEACSQTAACVPQTIEDAAIKKKERGRFDPNLAPENDAPD